ncbi:MAG: polysaccharide biosynthesis tyrosine autokinase [Candidatus Kryptonium sp.]|nr:polysaccharide biosynthesis tyrosine autokinase [Candidatus Kryptonium sp.]MCX7762094.1 polysaccharide biosynthesis tyrosine autokinase [Candidatus Kryptonium sp.]
MEKLGTNGQPFFQPEEETINLYEVIQVLYRGKWLIILVFILVVLATAIFTFMQDPIYESTAVILIEKGKKGLGLSEAFDITGLSEQRNIKNEIEILKSRSLAEAVAKKLINRVYIDPENKKDTILVILPSRKDLREGIKPFASIETILERFEKNVKVESPRDADIIKITARSKNPKEAALIANTFADAYYERNLLMSRNESRSVRKFLEEQLADKKKILDQAESQLETYMKSAGVVALDEESRKLIEQLSDLESKRGEAIVEISTAQKKLNAYLEQIKQIEPEFVKVATEALDPYIKYLQEEIAKLEVTRDQIVAQNPKVGSKEVLDKSLREIDEQLASLRKKLQEKISEFLKTGFASSGTPGTQTYDPTGFVKELKQKILLTEIELTAYEAKKKELDKLIAQLNQKFETIPSKLIDYARLERARMSSEKLYLLIEEKYQEAMIAEQSQFGYVQIIDYATPEPKPVSPKVHLNLILSVIIGLGLGVGIVFIREFFDRSVKTPEQLEKKGFTVLSAIPIIEIETKLDGKQLKKDEGRNIAAHLITHLSPKSPVAEAYRVLRTGIQFAKLDRKIKSIIVASSAPKEGKSTTASNLAITMAKADLKTVLLDTDLRRPVLHRVFSVKREPGLTDYLFGRAEIDTIFKQTDVDNLYLVPCGVVPPNPSELLGSEKMKEFIEYLKLNYDFIIFDTPPLVAVTDALILANQVDGVLLVASAGKTEIDVVDKAREMIHRVGGNVIGVLLNNFDASATYGTYYRYYRYYRYYDYYGADRDKS